jgi:hypothetical protein
MNISVGVCYGDTVFPVRYELFKYYLDERLITISRMGPAAVVTQSVTVSYPSYVNRIHHFYNYRVVASCCVVLPIAFISVGTTYV